MIRRRDFLKISAGVAAASVMPHTVHAFDIFSSNQHKHISDFSSMTGQMETDFSDYYKKIKNFNSSFVDDLVADEAEFKLIKSCRSKTYALMRYVGFGNYNILNFDDALRIMRNASQIEVFTAAEINYIDMLFHRDASEYGFYGEKIFNSLTDWVNSKEMVKVPGTGHYIYKGDALNTYDKITGDMKSLTLTSGVRSVMKQLHLFLNKAVATDGNLSMASRSIAPVGYSYHGIGDFDVGIKGWGAANFTNKFATTSEYSRLMKNGYMRIRYDRTNPYGVRFEPWHVKVV